MKILELRLLACGPFSDLQLDLSGGDRGLHLIYGANEAGKSSALRAMTYLFFGFPQKPKDNFVHQYPALRVGARIRDERGEELDFVRRKANKSSLRQRDDATLIEDEALRRFLGDIDETRFKQFFGIDHTRLTKGGQEIIEGGGDTGQILFSAGGVNDLKAVLDSLEKDAKDLFAPTARNPTLNQLLSKLADEKKAVRDNQLPAAEWQDHHAALDTAMKRKDKVVSELQESTREKGRLERISKALPLIAEMADLRQKAEPLSDAVLLPADFSTRRQKAQRDLQRGEDELDRATKTVDKLQRQLADLAIPEALLQRRAEIEPLAELLGAFRKAQNDRPSLEAEARQIEQATIETLRRLGQDLDLAAAESLQIPDSKRLRIHNVGERYAGLVHDVDQWNSKLAESTHLLEENHVELAKLPALQDVAPLSMAVEDTLKLGNVEADLSAASHERETSAEQIAIALKQFPLWSGPIEEIETLPAPLAETVDRFEEELNSLDGQIKDLDRKSRDCQTEDRAVNQKLEALRLEFELPTEVDLQGARERRQQGWQLIRSAWQTGLQDADAVRAFVESVGPEADLADAFEQSVEMSDQIADRLRREAERVATHAQLLAQQTDCAQRLASAAEQQKSATEQRDAKRSEWNGLWQSICSKPLSPREMRSWSRRHTNLVQDCQSLRKMRDRIEQLQSRVAEQRLQITGHLQTFSDVEIPAAATLEQLVGMARRVLDEAAAIGQRRRDLSGESARLEKEQKRAQEKLTAAEAKLSRWQAEWSEAIAELPLDPAGGPSEANIVLDLLAKLSQQLQSIRAMRGRITDIDRDAELFTADVRAAAAQVAPDLHESSIANLAADLGIRLSKAITADETRKLLNRQLTDEQQRVDTAWQTIRTSQSQLTSLCSEAKCESDRDLPDAEERSKCRRDLEKEIHSLEEHLREYSAGQALAVFIAEAQSVDADALPLRIQQLEEQVKRLNHELTEELGPKIGAEQTELKKMDCSATAADANERVQDLTLQIGGAAQEYARLQIALVTLRKGIERYRERHQGPIIQRSSELFARLTLGAFSGVREDYDTDGKPELVAIRAADERLVRVTEMSDGSADQLFLAVRLAWLGEYLESHAAIPFIVDDILIQFDDERSTATLQVLAELSARTQVILFTHHRHVVDLAQKTIEGDTLFVHELSSGCFAH